MRKPCCDKEGTNKGAWSKLEDQKLIDYIRTNGEGCWRSLPKAAGLDRCGKSCRLRWINYLRPDIKRGNFGQDEEDLIIKLHALLGNRWSLIAGRLPGRTDNEVKNYWNSHIRRKLISMGIDPNNHRLNQIPLRAPPKCGAVSASATSSESTNNECKPPPLKSSGNKTDRVSLDLNLDLTIAFPSAPATSVEEKRRISKAMMAKQVESSTEPVATLLSRAVNRGADQIISLRVMRTLAAQLTSYLCRRKPGWNVQSRNFSSLNAKDELSLEQDAERKIGWLLKLFFAGTASAVAYQFFPYLGDNLMQQSVSLLHIKDPLFKRMGASRLARFAIDDERRMKIVEMGGAKELLKMLGAAKDDRTRKEALKALAALSHSDDAVRALHHAGAVSVIRCTPDSSEDAEVEKHKSSLLKRFQDLRYDASS